MGLLRRTKTRIRQILGKELHFRPDIHCRVERHGSAYGGWNVRPDDITRDSVVYSFGIGEDISFEESLIASYGMKVYAFDPTPRSQHWLAQRPLPPGFTPYAFGLASTDEVRTFAAPANPAHISLTAVGDQAATGTLSLPVRRLSSIMAELHHTHLDILKMDIEGCEYEVIDDLVRGDIRPRQLLVEFHHRRPDIGRQKTIDAVANLRRCGYRLFKVADTGEEFSFLYGN